MGRITIVSSAAVATAVVTLWAWSCWRRRTIGREVEAKGLDPQAEPVETAQKVATHSEPLPPSVVTIAEGTASGTSEAAAPVAAQAGQHQAAPIDSSKLTALVALASKKKQSGNEALAAGKHQESLEFFEGALKALAYVLPVSGSAMIDDTGVAVVAEARTLQVSSMFAERVIGTK